MTLFPPDAARTDARPPLAERMRPHTLDDVVGHEAVLGRGTALRRLIDDDCLPSLVLFGPPGCGKTSIAAALADSTGATFETLSAVLAGVRDVREVVARAEDRLRTGRRTILFVDEIHRFNRAQQDAFLPHVERGTIVLIGATTENPGFHLNPPLLSRCRVVALEPLGEDALLRLADRALTDDERGLGGRGVTLAPESRRALLAAADGDGRALLNVLETAALATPPGARLVPADIHAAAGARSLRHDRAGESHHHIASALQKSIRSGDVQAGLYWCGRLLVAGEDPLFVARRLVVMASEDVGLARPGVLPIVVAAMEAVRFLGMPECAYALLQAVALLASSPRSGSVAAAWARVQSEIAATGALPVPLHLRTATSRVARESGAGRGYKYAHDYEGGMVRQAHLPTGLSSGSFLQPVEAGFEAEIARYLREYDEFQESGAERRRPPFGARGPEAGGPEAEGAADS